MKLFESNKTFYIFVLIGIFLFTIVSVFASYSFMLNPGHGADEIFIDIRGEVLSLQEAIDNEHIMPECSNQQTVVFDASGTGRWECASSAGVPELQQIVEIGVSSAQCPSGWIRSGCSGGRFNGDSNGDVRPSGSSGCAIFGASDGDVHTAAHCVRFVE